MISQFFGRIFRWTVFVVLVIEVLSFTGHVYPFAHLAAALALLVTIFILSVRQIRYGMWAILAELVIGSKGQVFTLSIVTTEISFRLALFLTVGIAWLVWILVCQHGSWRLIDSVLRRYLPIGIMLGLGVIVGLIRGNDLAILFVDVNGYLFLGMAFVFGTVLVQRKDITDGVQVLLGAVAGVIIKTLLLLYTFSHSFSEVLPGLYRWVRDTGVGEITLLAGNVYRIFFQSHIFVVIALFLLFGVIAFSWNGVSRFPWKNIGTGVWISSVAVVVISLSRSFWVGIIIAAVVSGILLFRMFRFALRDIFRLAGIASISILAGIVVVYVVIAIPIPPAAPTALTHVLSERVSDATTEAAAVSRWQLAPPLLHEILQRPILGSGYGSTVTYTSSDPRIVEATGGVYTTYAFEWGYLDTLLETGIVGFVLLFSVLWMITRRGMRALRRTLWTTDSGLVFGLFAAWIFLLVTHAISPYLNHPLGLGALLLIDAAFLVYARIEEPA